MTRRVFYNDFDPYWERAGMLKPLITHAPTIDAERALWTAVLEEAVANAQGQGVSLLPHEIADARAFLRAPARCGPILEALDINTAWFQGHLRRQYPAIWAEPVLAVPPTVERPPARAVEAEPVLAVPPTVERPPARAVEAEPLLAVPPTVERPPARAVEVVWLVL